MMALDDVAPSTIIDDERFKEATMRTLRWIDRCISAHTNPETQNLFGIVQGISCSVTIIAIIKLQLYSFSIKVD